jgi:DnaJ-class molecular chaperone
MNLAEIHAEIAKERFLDLMSQLNGDFKPEIVAVMATKQADEFMQNYRPFPATVAETQMKGCRACHGSGGKARSPCKVCDGTGRVAA